MIEPPGPPSIVLQIHSNTDAEVLMLIENLILYWALAYKVRVFVEKPIVWLERSGGKDRCQVPLQRSEPLPSPWAEAWSVGAAPVSALARMEVCQRTLTEPKWAASSWKVCKPGQRTCRL